MKHTTILLLLLVLIASGCARASSQPPDDGLAISLAYEPDPAVMGDATLLVTVRDAAGQPVADATVNVKGDMNHAGMVPVLAEATAGPGGVYELPFRWTMSGSWIVTVDVTLANGAAASRRFDVSVSLPDS
jgi:hypothetical protein